MFIHAIYHWTGEHFPMNLEGLILYHYKADDPFIFNKCRPPPWIVSYQRFSKSLNITAWWNIWIYILCINTCPLLISFQKITLSIRGLCGSNGHTNLVPETQKNVIDIPMISLYFLKVFNTGDRGILPCKFSRYEIWWFQLKWVERYLSNWKKNSIHNGIACVQSHCWWCDKRLGLCQRDGGRYHGVRYTPNHQEPY